MRTKWGLIGFWMVIVVVVVAGGLVLQSFQFDGAVPGANLELETWPSKRDLWQKMREIRKELIVYGTGDRAACRAYRQFAEDYARRGRWYEFVAKADTAITAEEIRQFPLWLIGTPKSNSVLRRLREGLPFRYEEEGLAMGRYAFDDSSDVFVLSRYPNPLQPDLPISVTTGNDDAVVVHFLESQHARSLRGGDFRAFRGGLSLLLGFFRQEGGGPWLIDDDRTRDYVATWHEVLQTEHYTYIYHGDTVPTEAIRALARHQERRLKRLLNHVPQATRNADLTPHIEYHLYEHPEDKGLITGNTDLRHAGSGHRVHVLFTDYLRGDDFFADARLLCAKYFGESESLALREGLALYFSEGWRKHGFLAWARRFYETGDLPALRELLTKESYAQESYLVMRPSAASFVAYLIETFGWEAVLAAYAAWPASGLPDDAFAGHDGASLKQGWHRFLDSVDAQIPVTRRSMPAGFHKGFCYAHEGYSIYNGYLSRQSFSALKKLRNLGTNWISVTPFGYLSRPDQASVLWPSFGAGSENDESLVTAQAFARELGMGVMLKPHLLMRGPHWGWPGDIDMPNEAEWQRFFHHYYQWIRHYALLAEMYDMDLFCIGVELMHATRDHDAAWREIIRRIRQIYHGPLVYAANWWEEFEHITFWDALDYMGLNCYHPLAQEDTVTTAELRRGASEVVEWIRAMVEKHDKPLLITEIGFTSRPAPWKNPHERHRGAPVDLEAQKRAYEVMFEALRKQPWLHGLYWWKWPTELIDGGARHNGFTPNSKPAERVVERWYARTWPLSDAY